MTVSVRAYLMAGAAAATATTIALTSVQVTPPDVVVPAQPTAPQPELTQAMVDLLAAARRTTITIPVPPDAPRVAPPHGNAAPDAQATASGDITVQNAASDFVVDAWEAAVPWIDYGVGLVDGALGWVPGLAIVGNQVSLLWTYLGYPVANSVVLDLVAPVVNAPLNLDVWANGFGAVASTTANSLVNTGVAEFNYFFGWLIPPVALTTPTETLAFDATVGADLLKQARAAVTSLVEPAEGAEAAEASEAPKAPESLESPEKPETKTPDAPAAEFSAPAGTTENTASGVTENAENTATNENTETTEVVEDTTTPTKAVTSTKAPVKPVRTITKNIKRDLKKATAGLRGVVKDIRDGLVKPKKPATKPSKKAEPAKKAEPSKQSASESSSSDSDD